MPLWRRGALQSGCPNLVVRSRRSAAKDPASVFKRRSLNQSQKKDLPTTWKVGGFVVFGAAALLFVASVSGKLDGVQLAGKILHWEKGEASTIGWLGQTKALIMIIFVNILLDKRIVTSETFTATPLMAIVSTMLTVPVVSPRLQKMTMTLLKAA